MRNKEMLVQVLWSALWPRYLRVTDDSGRHRGHAGVQGLGGLTHADIEIVSSDFVGETPVQRQRRVLAASRSLLSEGLHAVRIRALTPDEWTHIDAPSV